MVGGKKFCDWESFKFMKKLEFVKNRLNDWNKEVFGDIRGAKILIINRLGEVDVIEGMGVWMRG